MFLFSNVRFWLSIGLRVTTILKTVTDERSLTGEETLRSHTYPVTFLGGFLATNCPPAGTESTTGCP